MVSFTVASVSVPSHVKQKRHRRSVEKFAPLPPAVTGETKGAGETEDQVEGPPGEL
jgi:hypothetical protein